ncbi:MAG: VPLPA-CTERM sorting domain-containing protein [Proteobacteria bacterium]|nr:VPLPA-CTERM sorting domain-containing protein [Pseudomonadota bacterium]MBU1386450.1 VPLPA-CTERM sorting domain-containing protein [Pseudomonadota bacterium]MBU1544561.1 VPLPA-CTERM sorting domain-containing protein [Pseudomonadota bacterium]MBU2429712.1 VPLPA-CTERM sorting domain-containing protein [Pseudomonadota bacterium]MBU2481228.1 VPLPA-CTERM sorting domain-containing protein [Pseudomonadota bacterium]
MKKLYLILTLLLVLFVFSFNTWAALIIITSPTDDVRIDKNEPTKNWNSDYHDSELLGVRYSDGGVYHSRSLLMFDLSAIPDAAIITGATLHIYSIPTSSAYVSLNRMADDNWAEGAVTWNSYQGSFSSAQNMGGHTVVHTNSDPAWEEFSMVLNNWSWADDLSDNQLTLMLGSVTNDGAYSVGTTFYSKEWDAHNSTNFRPYLTVEYSQVPVPAAVWLFASGLIGLVGLRRKQTKD